MPLATPLTSCVASYCDSLNWDLSRPSGVSCCRHCTTVCCGPACCRCSAQGLQQARWQGHGHHARKQMHGLTNPILWHLPPVPAGRLHSTWGRCERACQDTRCQVPPTPVNPNGARSQQSILRCLLAHKPLHSCGLHVDKHNEGRLTRVTAQPKQSHSLPVLTGV